MKGLKGETMNRISFALVIILVTQFSMSALAHTSVQPMSVLPHDHDRSISHVVAVSHAWTRFEVATDANPKIQKENEAVWSDVNVNLSWLVNILNSKSCAASIKAYIGCALAMETFAQVLNKQLEVIPLEQLGGKTAVVKTERLALVDAVKPAITTPKDAYGYFEKMRAQMNARFLTSAAAFVNSPNLDFELLINTIYGKAQGKVSSATYVATVSKFLEVAQDPHTSIMPTKLMQQISGNSGDSFVGIGVEFMRLDQGLIVKKVMKNSGAEKAGVLSGDIIVAVDGKSVKTMADDEIVAFIRGDAGTKVTITLIRANKSMDFVVTRLAVVNPVLSTQGISYNGKMYAYVRLTNFMYDNICEEFAVIVANWEKQNIAGYVLDLRDNGGGNVQIAACIGGLFLGSDKVLTYFESRTLLRNKYEPLMTKSEVTTTKPLSILVNAYSASASELVAGSIKDYGRGYIVGQTSFGKGSYQSCGPIQSQPALYICSTRGLFFAPSGNTNQTVGVVPHIEVYLNKTAKDSETYARREAQMFLYPIPPKKMPNSPAGNWDQLKAPTQCLLGLNLASIYDMAVPAAFYYKDYQLLNAVAAVSCGGKN